MAHLELVAYIKQQLQKGETPDIIHNSLKEVGWQDEDINEALEVASNSMPKNKSFSAPEHSRIEESTVLISETQNSPNKFGIDPSITDILKQKSFDSGSKKITIFMFSKKTVLIPFLILLIGGISAFAYFNFYQNPDRIMAKMWKSLSTVKSGEYTANIIAQTTRGNTADFPFFNLKNSNNFKIGIDGKFDLSNPAKEKFTFSSTINTDIFPTSSPNSYLVEGGASDGTLYFKTNNIPSMPLINLTILKDQWIKFDWEPKKLFGDVSSNFSDAKQKIEATLVLPIKEIDGEETYHYFVKLDNETTKNILNAIAASNPDLVTAISTAKELKGEIWIGKKTFLLKQFSLETTFDGKNNGVKWDIQIQGALKNLNQSQQITNPEVLKTIEEIAIESVINNSTSSTSTKKQ